MTTDENKNDEKSEQSEATDDTESVDDSTKIEYYNMLGHNQPEGLLRHWLSSL